MDIRDSAPDGEADLTAAVPLEISEETASRADDLLREFAEDAGLDTVLVVDRSGALVAGISAEADVTVEVISALVAGATGAMRALVAQLGETGAMESLHLGGDRLIYLKETVRRFVLVAVAESSRPAGLVRQKALAIEGRLADLLRGVRSADPPALPLPTPARSLRETVRERAERRLAATPSEAEPEVEPAPEAVPADLPEIEEPVALPCDFEPGAEETFETLDLRSELDRPSETEGTVAAIEDPAASEAGGGEGEERDSTDTGTPDQSDQPDEYGEPVPPSEPREILEPIEIDEPEIVVETSAPPLSREPSRLRLPVDSPFETDEGEDEEEAEGASPRIPGYASVRGEDSVFEYDEQGDDEDEEGEPVFVSPPDPPRPPEATDAVAMDAVATDAVATDAVATDADGAGDAPAGRFEAAPFSLFEEDDDTEDEEEEEDQDKASGADNIFEFDEEDDDEAKDEDEAAPVPLGNAGKPQPGSARGEEEVLGRELVEMIEEGESESEIRGSGPFYF